MEKFNNWINNPKRDYLTGLALYNKHKLSTKHDAFFNVANPSLLHINMLLSRILKIFHILKTTGYFKNPTNKPDQVTPKIKPISIKKKTNQKPISTEAESPRQRQNRSGCSCQAAGGSLRSEEERGAGIAPAGPQRAASRRHQGPQGNGR